MIFLSVYFTTFFAHLSQYFTMMVAPSTLNNASRVAMLPQLRRILAFHQHQQMTVAKKRLFLSIVSPYFF